MEDAFFDTIQILPPTSRGGQTRRIRTDTQATETEAPVIALETDNGPLGETSFVDILDTTITDVADDSLTPPVSDSPTVGTTTIVDTTTTDGPGSTQGLPTGGGDSQSSGPTGLMIQPPAPTGVQNAVASQTSTTTTTTRPKEDRDLMAVGAVVLFLIFFKGA